MGYFGLFSNLKVYKDIFILKYKGYSNPLYLKTFKYKGYFGFLKIFGKIIFNMPKMSYISK